MEKVKETVEAGVEEVEEVGGCLLIKGWSRRRENGG